MSAETMSIFSPKVAARFDALVEKYPVRRSALVPMLLYAQDEIGYLSDAVIAEVAQRIGITELDVDPLPRQGNSADITAIETGGMNPYVNGFPDSEQQKLAQRYSDLFTLFARHSGEIERVTFWGLDDGQSWLNNFPVPGRTNYPLLFDRQDKPKPAFFAVVDALNRVSK